MRSGYVTAPTFGGASWLSHSSLLAGHEISAHDDYESFLHSSREHIVDRFGRAGYRTILLTPGIRGPWPAGLALRFDRIIDASDVHYPGPGFGWWYIPDQYSLDHLNREELSASDRAPLFAMFPTIMSHFPFGPTPPYLQNWASLSADIPYASGDVERSEALGDAISGDRESAYLRSILYEIEAATGFVQNRAPEKSIIVVLGDHQPPAAISGESANWDVPVHIFARDPALLAPFEGKGAIPGMIPSGATIGRIDELNALLLEALEQPDASLIAVSSRNR
jgi:hypothetical protein